MQKQLHGGDIYRNKVTYDFSANINPMGTPDGVIEAMIESLSQIGNYPDIHCTKLVQELAREEQVSEEMLLCGNGAADLIFSLVQAAKPKKALIQSPTFMEYEMALKSVSCDIRYFHSKRENQYAITQDFLDCITEDLDLVFLCNPNNPTGALIPPALLEKIAGICKQKKVMLVIDECFQDFVEEPYTMKHTLCENPYVFILKAFTKKYAMAGVRLGYGISGNQQLLENMKEMTQPWSVSIVAQAAGVAALQETDYVKESMAIIAKQRTYLKEELKKLGLYVYDSKANYIFFEGPVTLYEDSLAQGLLIRDCSNYVGLEAGTYRIAVRSEAENKGLLSIFRNVLGKK